ncbi:MAG: thiamine pyrophosphate-dependent dehydrogenase E1 component subunit alpha, partial [Oligoflexus sp.]
VLSGKAKFGIFGDGKELAQLAMARVFLKGDWRSGYYRDQTFMLALGSYTIKQFFAQLYADTDLEREPASGGRQMNSHFASRFVQADGEWLSQLERFNTSADASPTACQMGRLLGLGYASKLYRYLPGLDGDAKFSRSGQEVAFGTIGNASTSEGIFWETLNAAGVLEVPVVISIWDDEYGISVPNKYQTTKESISKICAGFAREKHTNGYNIHTVRGWDYPELLKVYREAVRAAREQHIPALIHVIEMSQPQGHSTSGSHERYKSKDRLAYEQSIDCLSRMREWMLQHGISQAKDLDQLESDVRSEVLRLRNEAWEEYLAPMKVERDALLHLYQKIAEEGTTVPGFQAIRESFQRYPAVSRKSILSSARRVAYVIAGTRSPAR